MTASESKMVDNLIVACEDGNLEEVKFLVESGVDFRTNNDQAIACASSRGHLEIVKYLASIGANVGDGNDWAITWASKNSHFETVKYLVSIGADVRAGDNIAIKFASIYGCLETIKYLVSAGADVNSGIEWASFNDHLESVKYLLSQGANFNKLSHRHTIYFRSYRAFRRWRMVIFKRFFRKTVIPLYYSPGFPGATRVRSELLTLISPKEKIDLSSGF